MRADTFGIGDTNLDYNKWLHPEQDHNVMTELVQDRLDTKGFVQSVTGDTRFWPHTVPSLVYQCWSNCPERIIKLANVTRGSSDHNLIEINIRVSENPHVSKEVLMRNRTNLDMNLVKAEAAMINWSQLLETENIDLANNIFEEELKVILDRHMPIISRQISHRNKKWIRKSTRDEMSLRDRARQTANQSQSDNDWRIYRTLRNRCTQSVKKDKKDHFTDIFNKLDEKQDINKLYSNVKTQLGWSTNGPPTSLLVNGRTTCSSQKMADEQLNYYQKKINKLMERLPVSNIDPTSWLRGIINKWGVYATQRPIFDFSDVTLWIRQSC